VFSSRAADRSVAQGVWQQLPATRISAVADNRPGALRTTNRDMDLAIVGEGFFVVGEGDEKFYTRNGSFRLDKDRNLVTADGLKLQGTSGPVTVEGASLGIAEDGTVTVDGNEVGRIKVVRFSDPGSLEHVAGSRFRPPPDLAVIDIPPNEVQVVQGQLEHSNVNAIDTLIDMITAQRAFEVEAKILQANDETLDRSVNQLGRKA
jgi:flagellar basal-body rod protein FlgG